MPGRSYPNGAHFAEVEIDPETGRTEVVKYTVVDDFGYLINPMLAEGQVHGGVAQGIGQAITEQVAFSPEGQLLTGSFMDYAMPRASDVPLMAFHTELVPSTANAIGMKGCGEAGTVGALAAVTNAALDAVWDAGVRHVDMPLTPVRVWSWLQAAPSGGGVTPVSRVTVIGATGHVGSYLVPRLVAAGHTWSPSPAASAAPYRSSRAWDAVETPALDRDALEADDAFGTAIAATRARHRRRHDLLHPAERPPAPRRARRPHPAPRLVGTIWTYGISPRRPDPGACAEDALRRLWHPEGRDRGLPARRGAAPAAFPRPSSIPATSSARAGRRSTPPATSTRAVFSTLARGARLALPNFGLETVHHVHADDVAGVIMAAIENWRAATGESFNAVSPRRVTLRGYAEAMAAWFGQPADLAFQPFERMGRVPDETDRTADLGAHRPQPLLLDGKGPPPARLRAAPRFARSRPGGGDRPDRQGRGDRLTSARGGSASMRTGLAAPDNDPVRGRGGRGGRRDAPATSVVHGDVITYDTWNARYCELLLVEGHARRASPPTSTTPSASTPATRPRSTAIDADAVKAATGARAVVKNGPRFWVVPALSSHVSSDAGPGHDLRRPRDPPRRQAYADPRDARAAARRPTRATTIQRDTEYGYPAGRPVFILDDPDGSPWVMQAYSQIVDPTLTLADLAGLGARLKLPTGWKYRTAHPRPATSAYTRWTAPRASCRTS